MTFPQVPVVSHLVPRAIVLREVPRELHSLERVVLLAALGSAVTYVLPPIGNRHFHSCDLVQCWVGPLYKQDNSHVYYHHRETYNRRLCRA